MYQALHRNYVAGMRWGWGEKGRGHQCGHQVGQATSQQQITLKDREPQTGCQTHSLRLRTMAEGSCVASTLVLHMPHHYLSIALYLVVPAWPLKQFEFATHTREKYQHFNITGLPSSRRRVGAKDREFWAGAGSLGVSSGLPNFLCNWRMSPL